MLSFLPATKRQQASSGRQSIFQPAESNIFAKVTHLSFQSREKFAARKKLKYNPQFATCYVQCNWKRKNCFKLIGWYRKRASSGPASDDSSLVALKNAKNGREKSEVFLSTSRAAVFRLRGILPSLESLGAVWSQKRRALFALISRWLVGCFFETTRARFTGQRKAVVHKTMIANEACWIVV